MESHHREIPTLIKDEFTSIISPFLTILLATLVVFTLPIWDTHFHLLFIILIILLVPMFLVLISRLLHFCFRKKPHRRLRLIFIPLYLVLLAGTVSITIAGHIYWSFNQVLEYSEVNTYMTLQRESDNGEMVPFRSTPYGRGRANTMRTNGYHVFVSRYTYNSHANRWYETELGWVYSGHLEEISDPDTLQELLMQRFPPGNDRNHFNWLYVLLLLFCVACLVGSAILFWKSKHRKPETENDDS